MKYRFRFVGACPVCQKPTTMQKVPHKPGVAAMEWRGICPDDHAVILMAAPRDPEKAAEMATEPEWECTCGAVDGRDAVGVHHAMDCLGYAPLDVI